LAIDRDRGRRRAIGAPAARAAGAGLPARRLDQRVPVQNRHQPVGCRRARRKRRSPRSPARPPAISSARARKRPSS